MKNIDPVLLIYSVGGLIIIFATFVVLALLTEGVKGLNRKIHDEEKKKSEEQNRKKAA